jgi:hypothetical protein
MSEEANHPQNFSTGDYVKGAGDLLNPGSKTEGIIGASERIGGPAATDLGSHVKEKIHNYTAPTKDGRF